MKTIRVFSVASSLIMLAFTATAQSPRNQEILHVGVVFDGPWDRNGEIVSLLRQESQEILRGHADVVFPDEKVLVGDWTVAGSVRLNERLLADREVELVIGFGVFTSQDLARRATLPKPVIAPIVVDPRGQNIPIQAGTSGVHNLSYLVFPGTYARDFKLLQEIVPFKKLAFLTSKRYHEGVPSTRPSDAEMSKVAGAEFVTIRFDDIAADAFAALPKDADAVYLDVMPLPLREFDKLVQGFIDRRLPSFSMMGETEVKRGMMAAANPDIFQRLIRRIALNIHRIVSGEDAGSLPVAFPPGKRLFINLATAYAVGVSPKWNTLLEAELMELDTTRMAGAEQFTLETAVRRIVKANLDIQAKMREISAAAEDVAVARANLFPKIDLSAMGLQIDQDRARAGSQPERRGSMDIGVTQVIFSEPALANLGIQSSLQESRASDYEVTRLNIIADGAKLYLNYLRARKAYYILLDNLKVTRSNLELAQIRQSTGAAGPDEPLRWEVEIANLKKSVMDTYSGVNQALLALKQVMNIPLVYTVNIGEVSLDDTVLLASDKRFLTYLEDPVSFELITDFLVQEGLERSHELKQLDALIEAQERSLSSTRYSFFVPSVAAFANYTNTFYKSAVRSPFQLTSIPPLPASIPPELPVYLGQLFSTAIPPLPDRRDWNVGIQFSLNLFNGFSTRAVESQASQTLERLRLQRMGVVEKLSLGIRAKMERVRSAHFAIQQSELERDAARRGLDIVTESYSQGALSILSLLDAQNSTLRANLVAANAFYDFFVEYMQLQRAVGDFDILMTQNERQELIDRLGDFMNRRTRR